MTQRLTFSAGEVIFKQGYPSDVAYKIISGKVEIYNELAGGGEQHIATLEPGEMFGEYGVLDDAPRSASARAAEDTELEVKEL